MQRAATRARALGLLAACARAQGTSQPELMVIAHNFAEHLARFLSSLRFFQRLRDGGPGAPSLASAFTETSD